MHLASSYNIYMNQQDEQNSCDFVHLVGSYTYCKK